MKILAAGAVVFVIWSFFSTWLYVDVLRRAAKKPVAVQPVPETRDAVADSIAKIYAMMPKDLMIYFEFDKYRFNPDPQLETSLNEFKNWLDKYPASMIIITGHTDIVGEDNYNQALGLKRAGAVQEYLSGKGFPAERMSIVSVGRSEPAADYLTAEGRAKNRRAVVSVRK